MAMKVEKIDIWAGEIRDETGGMAAALKPLVAAGVNFSFVIGRRRAEKPGTGTAFFAGIKGARQTKAAALGGFSKSEDAHGLRVEAADKPGLLHDVVSQLALAAINLRGVSASVIGSRCAIVLAFDGAADRDKAAKILGK
jgi:hypothetical protein